MPFHDFEIRAWVVGRTQAAVVVHSSPAGAMQRPETVSLDRNRLSPFLDIFAGSSKIETEVIVGLVAAGGRELGSILFPEQVIGMLIRSLERIDPECGLRVRLCLDSELSDLPWEYLILPQAAGLKAPGGFLALDARVSLVREPPQPGKERPRLQKTTPAIFWDKILLFRWNRPI